MGSSEQEVYIMQEADGEEWRHPAPAGEVILSSVCQETELEREDLDDVDSYVDRAELIRVLVSGTEERVTFTVEGHEVAVTDSGDVEVVE